jgi:hypothetical protein
MAGCREEHRSTTFDAVVRSAGLEPSGRAHARALEAYHAFWEPHTFTDPDAGALFAQLRERRFPSASSRTPSGPGRSMRPCFAVTAFST